MSKKPKQQQNTICPLSAILEIHPGGTRGTLHPEVVQQSGSSHYAVLEGRKEHNREENQKESHRLPPHSLIFTNKAKEQNISIFFPLFLPKEHLHF